MSISRATDEAGRRIIYVHCDHDACGGTALAVQRADYTSGPLATVAALDNANAAGWSTNLMHTFTGPTLHFCPIHRGRHE